MTLYVTGHVTNESLHLINERIQKKIERLKEKKKKLDMGNPRPNPWSNYCRKDKVEGETDSGRPGPNCKPQ